jgi:hypothetical protein
MGSMKWWMDNPMRLKLQIIIKRTELFIDYLNSIMTKYPIVTGLINKVKNRLTEQSLSLQFYLQMDLIGKKDNINNANPYCFVSNNSVIFYDILGTFGTMPPMINVLDNSGGGSSSDGDSCGFYEVIIEGVVLGNYFYQAGQTMSSTTPIGPGGPSPSLVCSTAGGFLINGGGTIFGIGAYITLQTAGLASLWSLPSAALGGDMMIWGFQLIRGCNTKNKKGNEK